MNWKIIDTGASSASENMQTDASLLESLTGDTPILHLYDWAAPSATFGYFTRPEDYLNLPAAEEAGLNLARRPTGGGIILHTCDFAFSILVPAGHPAYSVNTLENYRFVNSIVISVINRFASGLSLSLLADRPQETDPLCNNFCMAKPTIYDVMANGKKIGGAAQRRTKAGFLHQGSIALCLPEKNNYLHYTTFDAMQRNTWPLLPPAADLREARSELKKIFTDQVC